MLEEKRARIEAMKALSDATLPDAALEQCVNWAKLRRLDAPHPAARQMRAVLRAAGKPALYGEGLGEGDGGAAAAGRRSACRRCCAHARR